MSSGQSWKVRFRRVWLASFFNNITGRRRLGSHPVDIVPMRRTCEPHRRMCMPTTSAGTAFVGGSTDSSAPGSIRFVLSRKYNKAFQEKLAILRFWPASSLYRRHGRIWSDMVGCGRVWWDIVGYNEYGGILRYVVAYGGLPTNIVV